MFLFNIKQLFRSLWRYKSFSVINMLGLSIGMSAVLLIFLIADYEKSFDQFHFGGNDIYRIVSRVERGGKQEFNAAVPYPSAKLLRNEYPGLSATQIHFQDEANVRIGVQSPLAEKNIVFADSLFFTVFDFAGIPHFALTGDPGTALAAPRKAILTESVAKKYFGSTNPIGEIINLDGKLDVEVAAVLKDPLKTTHLPFTILVSYASLTSDYIGGFDLNSWGLRSQGYCYVRVNEQTPVKNVEKALHAIVRKNSTTDRDRRQKFYLQPLSAIHFDPAFETSNPTYTISRTYLNILLLLGSFIILIACVNYINLSTSLAFSKSKEVGIRKTIGATRTQLFIYYMTETILLTATAVIIGVAIAYLFLPLVNHWLEKSISFHQMVNVRFVAGAVVVLLLVSFISGLYPALVASRFKPIESLKNQMATPGRSSTLLRRVLVVFQFTISIVMIICTFVIAKQMRYSNSKTLGFDKEAVVEVALPSPDSTKVEAFRSLLQNQSGIKEFSFCLGAPISDNGISTSMRASELPENADYSVKIIACDQHYLSTFGIKLLTGRWFLPGEEKKPSSGIVVNQTLVKTLGYRNPEDALGREVSIGIDELHPPIIGVVQDFHTTSLHQSIPPVALMPFPYFYYTAGVRIQPGALRNTMSNIEVSYKKVYPDYVYTVKFIDEELERLYVEDTRNFNLFKAFSVISIFICCIGLWGLIAFVVVRKRKEIGIRKVLGATVSSIVSLLAKDFLRLILIALVVASPVAYYLMSNWLENFAYRVKIEWWVFALAGLLAILIAFFTVSLQAVKAALANPVENLRTE